MFKIKFRGTSSEVLPCTNSSQRWEKIQTFIRESRKSQNLFATFEGSVKRVADVSDKNAIKSVIHSILFSTEDIVCVAEEDQKKNEMVENVTNEIIILSKAFDTPGEVHYAVIWVHYFRYDLNECEATPVFKVYKSKNLKEAVFLDVELNMNDGWINYLEKAKLPKCFMCVPNTGTYVPVGDSFDLLYMYYKGSDNYNIRRVPFSPFYKEVIAPLFAKFKEMLKDFLSDPEKLKIALLILTVALSIKNPARPIHISVFWKRYNIVLETKVLCDLFFLLKNIVQKFKEMSVTNPDLSFLKKLGCCLSDEIDLSDCLKFLLEALHSKSRLKSIVKSFNSCQITLA